MEQTRPFPSRPAAPSPELYEFAKRGADVLVAAALLVLLAPLLLVVAIAVWLDSGLPILYRAERLGRFGEPMTVLKFRTMRNGSDAILRELLDADAASAAEYAANRKLRHDPRRTRLGSLLRRTSLDELPQLVNVLRGEMSIIGPRPYFAHELLGRPEAIVVLGVRPGITGLWQVNGRSDRTFEERLNFDVEYVRERGFDMDSRIALGTVMAVLSGRGAY